MRQADRHRQAMGLRRPSAPLALYVMLITQSWYRSSFTTLSQDGEEVDQGRWVMEHVSLERRPASDEEEDRLVAPFPSFALAHTQSTPAECRTICDVEVERDSRSSGLRVTTASFDPE